MKQSIKTIKGYDMFEVISAFQKSIRRGKEDDAMFWGVELIESGFVNVAWKRMIVMSLEDVGLANPMAPVIIQNLKQMYDELNKNDKKKQYRLPYVQAILFLVHSKKSRYVDWALNYWFDSHLGTATDRQIPDYALDIHTRRGKIKGKTIEDFFTEGSIIENSIPPFPNEEFYRSECHKRWTDKGWCTKADAEKARRAQLHGSHGEQSAPTTVTQRKESTEPSLFG